MLLKLIGFGLALIFSLSTFAQNSDYIKEVPNWVVKNSQFEARDEEGSKSNGGEYPLLYDRQVNLDEKESFFHWTTILKNSESVSVYNTLEFSFDPSYQKLKIHFINVIRDGKLIDKINADEFRIITREENADRKLYDNNKTLISHLSDLRTGDVLDYAFSLKGQNPAYGDHQFTSQDLQSQQALESYYFSVLSSSQKLKYKLLNGAKDPLVKTDGNLKSYTWEFQDVKAFYYEENTPSWFSSIPHVSFSDLQKWQDVARISAPFYQLSKDDLAYFRDLSLDLTKSSDTLKMVQDLIRFVQDEIRYLGFEDGLNAFVPHNPKKVLEQRFGDCKDKSLLLVALLKSIGVNASPLLVNTYLLDKITDKLPSPYLFNHCVASFDLYGQTYYIDPTISNQGGDAFDIFFPDYGKVLNIQSQKLLEVPKKQKGKIVIDELLELGTEYEDQAYYRVKTTFTGAEADKMRSFFASNQLDYISKEYMKFYSNMYPFISLKEELSFEDNREQNSFETVEKYWVDSIWEKDKTIKDRKIVYVAPLMMQNYFHHQTPAQRSSDYFINFPCHITYDIIIRTPSPWTVEESVKEISNKEYTYRSMVANDRRKKEIHLQDMYWTNTNHIKAEDFPRFQADHSKMYTDSSFGIYSGGEEEGEGSNFVRSIIDFLIPIVLSIVALIGLIVFIEKRKEKKERDGQDRSRF